jgi:hypothetical protein
VGRLEKQACGPIITQRAIIYPISSKNLQNILFIEWSEMFPLRELEGCQ